MSIFSHALFAPALLGLSLAACTPRYHEPQSVLNEVADKCNLPRSTFVVDREGLISLHLPPGARPDAVACALKEIKASAIPAQAAHITNELEAK